MHTQAKKAGKAKRKANLLAQIETAQRAAQRRDQRTLFQVVRRLAPKCMRQRVQLRQDDNTVMNPAEELVAFMAHCQELFQSTAQPLSVPPLQAQFHIEPSELEEAFSALKLRKAVPSHTAPIAIWKLCSPCLSEVVSHMVREHWFGTPVMPPLWCDAWVTWLVKPQKVPRTPNDLRPIALTEASGKAITKVIQWRLLPYIQRFLTDVPQFAYVPGRSLDTALCRAAALCNAIRQDLKDSHVSLKQRFQGMRPTVCKGGMILSIDMTQAFDRANRTDLYTSLLQAGAPPDLISLIAHFHNSIVYHLKVSGAEEEVPCRRGVRQGCMVAPLLWDAISALMLKDLASCTDTQWVRDNVTMYADDFLGGWRFAETSHLDQAVEHIRAIVHVFSRHGMKLNRGKSKLLIQVRGRRAKRWLKGYVKRTPEGRVFCVKQGNEMWDFPIVDSVKYLGAVLSFGRYEDQTLELRLSMAELQRNRLRRLLNGRHALASRPRVHLWHSCVASTLYHSLPVIGLTSRGIRLLGARVLKHLRAILGSQVHITGESNAVILERAACMHPRDEVSMHHDRINASHTASNDPLVNSSVVLEHLARIRNMLDKLPEVARDSEDTGQGILPQDGAPLETLVPTKQGAKAALFVCEHCYLAFPTLSALKRHCKEIHRLPIPCRQGGFQRHLHGTLGLPTCKRCGKDLGTWNHLCTHIMENHCQALWLQEHCMESAPEASDNDYADAHLRTKFVEGPEGISESAVAGSQAQACVTAAVTSEDNHGTYQRVPADAAQTNASSVPGQQDEAIVEILRLDWLQLRQHPDLCHKLGTYCCLCNQWLADGRQMKIHLQRVHPAEWRTWKSQVDNECRSVATIMCSPCKWCGHHIAKPAQHAVACTVLWQASLLKYVQGLIAVPSAEAISGCPTASDQQPLSRTGASGAPATPFRAKDMRMQICGPAWRQLLDDPTVRDFLKQTCGVCADTVTNPSRMKVHYRAKHHAIWRQHSEATIQLCRTWAQVIAKPCQWCGSEAKRKDEHMVACTVLWQFCLLRILHLQDHANNGAGGGAVRESPTSAEGLGRSDEWTGRTGQQTATQKPTSSQAQGQGKRQGKDSLLQAFRRGSNGGSTPQCSQASSTQRGGHSSHSIGHPSGIPLESQGGLIGFHAASSVQDFSELAAAFRAESTYSGHYDEAGRSDWLAQGALGKNHEVSGHTGVPCSSHGGQLAEQRGQLDLPELEYGEGTTDPHGGLESIPSELHLAAQGVHRVGGKTGHHSQIPTDTQGDGRDARRFSQLPMRDLTPSRFSQSAPPDAHELAEPVGHAPCRSSDPGPANAAQSTRTGFTNHDVRKAILQLTLLNRGNTCYINATAEPAKNLTNRPQSMRIWPGLRLVGAGGKICKGTFVTVKTCSNESVELEDGTQLGKEDLFKYTRLPHAITYASCQGLTLIGHVVLFDTSSQHFTLRHLYVGSSRATRSDLLSVRVW